MAKYELKSQQVTFEEIALNDRGDKAVITADDPTLFDTFAAGYKRIGTLANSIPEKLEEIERQYEGKEDFDSVMEKVGSMSEINVAFSKEAISIIDKIFGDGTVSKRFCDAYEKKPNFLPDADLFFEFLDELTDVMEQIFDRKLERQQNASKSKMSKYQPQDFKKGGSK